MHDEVFFKECFDCQRQETYSVTGVKDNYFKCRVKRLALEAIYKKETKCPYFKRREADGEDTCSY